MRLDKEHLDRLYKFRGALSVDGDSFNDLLDTIAALESELSEAKAQVDGSVAAALEKMTAQLLPAFEAERANWIAIGVARGTEILREREAKALMKCGHPKACAGELPAGPSDAPYAHCTICAELSKREAEARAETAALLEKAACKVMRFAARNDIRTFESLAAEIRDLIPTSYAAALEAKLAEARLEEAKCIPVQLYELKSLNMYQTMRIEMLEKEIAAHRAAPQAPEEKEPNP